MNRDRLQEALRSLPRRGASDGFRQRLMSRLDEPGSKRRVFWVPLLATATTAVLAALLILPWLRDGASGEPVPAAAPPATRAASDPGPRQTARQELARLRSEHVDLQERWRALRRIARETEPVIYLGRRGGKEVVLDLRSLPPDRLRVQVKPEQQASVQHASY